VATELNQQAFEEALHLAEDIGTGTKNVTKSDNKKLDPLQRHYLSKAKPFTECTKDQIKHGLTPDHAKKRCAVLLDSSGADWRHHGDEPESDLDLSQVSPGDKIDTETFAAELQTLRMAIFDERDHPRNPITGRFVEALNNLKVGKTLKLPVPDPEVDETPWKVRKLKGNRFRVEPPSGRNYTLDSADEVANDPQLFPEETPDAEDWWDDVSTRDLIRIVRDENAPKHQQERAQDMLIEGEADNEVLAAAGLHEYMEFEDGDAIRVSGVGMEHASGIIRGEGPENQPGTWRVEMGDGGVWVIPASSIIP
jgi:hypothetical protein